MNDIKFVHLNEIEEEKLLNLMNHEMVGKLMPLLKNGFSKEDCQNFLQAKKELWNNHGFGPWAFIINDKFAGWGGLQPEGVEADFALVLHPDFWGWGFKIFNKIKSMAFEQMNIGSITILFPPSRKNIKAVTRFGFIKDGELDIAGEKFIRLRLNKPLDFLQNP